MSDESEVPTQPPGEKRSKGPLTVMMEAQKRSEERDERQDREKMELMKLAVDGDRKTIRMQYYLIGGLALALVVLVAFVMKQHFQLEALGAKVGVGEPMEASGN